MRHGHARHGTTVGPGSEQLVGDDLRSVDTDDLAHG